MIKYRLRCGEGHEFDSWFASSADYDRVDAAGHLACAVCGGGSVEKALMAPGVATADAPAPAARPLTAPAHPAEAALKALRKKIETESENVGRDFATEARRIHEGEAPKRAIWGEARPADAKALLDDGIPVAPLPWRARTDS